MSRIQLFSSTAVLLYFTSGALAAEGTAYEYDSQSVAQRSSLTIESTASDDAPVAPAKRSGQVNQKSANSKSTTNDKTAVDAKAATSDNASTIQEPSLLPPNVGSRATRSSASSTNSESTSTSRAGSRYSGNSQTSYSATSAPLNNGITRHGATSSRNQSTSYDDQTPHVSPNPSSREGKYRAISQSTTGESVAVPSTAEPMTHGDAMFLSGDNAGYNCTDGCDCCSFNPCGCCGWYGGVDYLLIRPTFSENQAYLKRTTVSDANENVTTTDTVVHQDFDYNSSVRAFFGYRFGCGDEIRFTYWNYGNDSHLTSGVAPQDGSIIYAGHGELNTLPGQHLEVGAGLQMNVYDIDYVKCACMGGGCNQCNPCGGCCTPWTLKYSAGIRIADVRRGDNTLLVNSNGSGEEAFFVSADYIGAGPRVGLEGRRFFCGSRASLFARSNLSLLLGEYDFKETRKTPPSSPTLTENFFDSHARVIPVAEIELGGSWQWSERVSLSAGYLFQAWWDLGQSEQIQGNVFLNPIDDSNILSFDGLFARIEICF